MASSLQNCLSLADLVTYFERISLRFLYTSMDNGQIILIIEGSKIYIFS